MPEVLGSKVIVSIRPARMERLGEELFGSVRLTAQIVGHEPGIKGSPGAAPDGIQVESLYPTPIICIARRDHPLAERQRRLPAPQHRHRPRRDRAPGAPGAPVFAARVKSPQSSRWLSRHLYRVC